jgi:predicted house-cleaning noncanonical NTP pyrophosphatase (MazG superfamily)
MTKAALMASRKRPTVKIIRDKLASRIPASAVRMEVQRGNVLDLLCHKMGEETDEFRSSRFTDSSELADMLEVVKALAHHSDIAWDKVEAECERKREVSGSFLKGFVYDADRDPSSRDYPFRR